MVSPTNNAGYKQDSCLKIISTLDRLHTPLKDFGIDYKRRGFINYLELYRSAYHQKTRISPINNGGYKQELDRSAYTTKRLWFRLQRRGFINYLELYRSAYTTKKIWFRLQTMVVINKSLVDLHTPLKDFGIAYKEGGFINYLELYRSAYSHQKTFISPTNNGGYKQEPSRSAYTTNRLSFRLQTMVVINKSLTDLHTPLKDLGIDCKEGGL